MKNLLITTALLAGTASMAYAETGVSFSGYGRFGLVYNDNPGSSEITPFIPGSIILDGAGNPTFSPITGLPLRNPGTPAVSSEDKEMQVSSRFRLNINVKTETDAGVTFGGRVRLQYSSGQTGADLSPALLYAEYNGVRLEVGNANAAYDSAALMYNSEIGFLDRSTGDPQGSYFSFRTGPYAASQADRMGIFASYSVGDFNGRISYITANQTNDDLVDAEEISISADYTFGQFTVSGAYAMDGAGIDGNDLYFIGAAYAVNDDANVGLNYFDEDTAGTTITLYGNYTFGATTVKGYVANNDSVGNSDDTTFGIGADYDLGGARLSGGVFTDYDGDLNADMGVRFDF